MALQHVNISTSTLSRNAFIKLTKCLKVNETSLFETNENFH